VIACCLVAASFRALRVTAPRCAADGAAASLALLRRRLDRAARVPPVTRGFRARPLPPGALANRPLASLV
jgi:hypothetical protein